MPCAKDIRKHIQSVKNTQQITRAMKMISAAKLYRSQKRLLAAKPYWEQLARLLSRVRSLQDAETGSPLFARREEKRRLVVVMTGNRGLAGGFNNGLVRLALQQRGQSVSFIAMGARGCSALASAGCPLERTLSFGDEVEGAEAEAAGALLAELYASESFDRVDIVYQNYISSGRQQPTLRTILPIPPADEESAGGTDEDEYLIEGDRGELLQALAERYVRGCIFQTMLETKTGEHIARMMAMSSATDNAEEKIRRLQIDYNRSRQAAITKELAEISGCVDALA